MLRRIESSRRRFQDYLERLRKKEVLQPELTRGPRRGPRAALHGLLSAASFIFWAISGEPSRSRWSH